MQALIASHLIWVLVRIYAGGPSMRWFALVVLILGLFSSVPFFVGFIMPDFFTAAMILGFYLLGFQWPALSPRERAYFLLLACVAISVHISHLPQALALAILVVVVHLVLGISLRSSLRQAATSRRASRAGDLRNSPQQRLIHRVFALFPAGQTFVLANMIDQGPARRNICREACPAAGFKLCAILDYASGDLLRIPLDRRTRLQRLGGFEGMRDEAKEIVAATIRTYPERRAGYVDTQYWIVIPCPRARCRIDAFAH